MVTGEEVLGSRGVKVKTYLAAGSPNHGREFPVWLVLLGLMENFAWEFSKQGLPASLS